MSGLEPSTMNIMSMAAGSLAHDNSGCINSLDLSEDGKMLLTSANDDTLHIYNVTSASKERIFSDKPYGASLAKFTVDKTILYASTKGKLGLLRHLNPNDQSYYSTILAHNMPISSLDISLYNNVVSTAPDNFFHLWDLRMKASAFSHQFPENTGVPFVRFDPASAIVILGHPYGKNSNRCTVKLFDIKKPSSPYAKWDIYSPPLNGLDISDDGRIISLSTDTNHLVLLEAIQGTLIKNIKDYINASGNCTASLSENGKWVAVGSEDRNSVRIFDVDTGVLSNELFAHPRAPFKSIWSKHYALLITACYNVIFWISV